MKEYINYHKHTHKSNVRTIDCIIKPIDYINRAKELNHKFYSVVEHGWAGNYVEDYFLCKSNDIQMIFGAELYIVKDRFVKDRSNLHIVIIAKNIDGFKQLNKIISESNITGFYYKNRIDLNLISKLDPSLFYCTTACVGGILSDKYDLTIFNFIKDHFKDNLFLEVQCHNQDIQKDLNKLILSLSKKHNLKLIHANDSHYIYPEQAKDRDLFLKGKNMHYDFESEFVLDYPSYDEIIQRYETQGILSKEQVISALDNTMILKNCEDLNLNKDVKMPNPFKGQATNEMFKDLIVRKWNDEKANVPDERHSEYIQGIVNECEIVLKTKMENYFLINEKIIDLAVNKYGGILTRTGRGSAVSFYINKLLGFTEIDRFDSEVPLYPTRFMSISRILETKSLPDIDFNTANPEPFIKASKEVLGEDNIYYMIALGTMQKSEAFRNLCRAYKLEMKEYNEVAKDLELYEKHPKWGEIIEESKKFIGVIDSVSPAPCAFLLLDKPISEELGLIKINNTMCVCLDGLTSDKCGYLKNDFLTVSVWDIISKTFKKINKPIPNIRELKGLLDNKVWDLYRDGITATLNQVDSDFATSLMKRYSAQTVAELTGFVAAIRPSFASLLDNFLNRKEYTTSIPEVDELLKDSFHYILYQESIMKFLEWCGIPEDSTYGIIKKIAKKVFPKEELEDLKRTLFDNFSKKVEEPEKFDDIWQVIEDAVRYSFNSAHALSVAWDSLYGAYLKANYPLEYYTVVLDHYASNTNKTAKIIKELNYFGIKIENIKFRKSIDKYTFDKDTNTIYKGIESVKFCNSTIALDLHILKDNKYNNFVDLLIDIKNSTSVNSRQLEILTVLNYFSEFGKNKKLLQIIEIFDKIYNRKQFNKKDLNNDELKEIGLTEELLSKYSGNITKVLYKDLDTYSIIQELTCSIPNKILNLKEQLNKELEYLEYCITVVPEAKGFMFVKDFKVYNDACKPYFTLYNTETGEEIKTKVTNSDNYIDNPFIQGNLLEVFKFETKNKKKQINGKWQVTNEVEQILTEWEVY